MKDAVVCFHIGRGGAFNNANFKTYRGEKTFSELVQEQSNYLFDREDNNLYDEVGSLVSENDMNGDVGILDYDGIYDTWECKYVSECDEEELRLITEDDDYQKTDNLEKVLAEFG